MRKFAFFAVLIAVLFTACKKNDTTPTPPAAPAITSFAPAQAAYDSTVTITGTGFSTTLNDNAVTLNGVAATVTSATATQLKISIPKNKACSGALKVIVKGRSTTAATPFGYLLTYTTVSTLAGNGTAGYADGAGTAAKFFYPNGVTVDGSGNIYVADAGNNRIRKITPAGMVSTIAGDGTAGYAEGTGTAAKFNNPTGVAVGGSGNIYVADQVNHRMRKITPAGMVSTIAGDGTFGYADGTAMVAKFKSPVGVIVDGSENIYVAEFLNHNIRKITPAGMVSTIAGDGTQGYADGVGTAAKFFKPTGVAVDGSGNIYVADGINQRIRKITPAGTVSTIAGDGTQGYADGVGTAAKFNYPYGVALDGSGNIYVADAENNHIRKITPAGMVSTIAGDGTQGYADGAAKVAKFNYPTGVALDGSGNIYVVDENHRVRKIVGE